MATGDPIVGTSYGKYTNLQNISGSGQNALGGETGKLGVIYLNGTALHLGQTGSAGVEAKSYKLDVTGHNGTIGLSLGGSVVTSTADELNIMDGVTATTAELNIMDGVTATTSELNILDGVTSTATELNLLDGSTANSVVNSKAVVYGASGQVAATSLTVSANTSGSTAQFAKLTASAGYFAELHVSGTTLHLGDTSISAAEIAPLDGVTAGTVAASKAVVVDSNKDITDFRNVTLTGKLDAGSLDVSGNIDVDGTTNLDAVDIDGAVQIDNTVTVGANDQGYDVIFYGDTASANMTWDTSADDLILNGAAGLVVPDGQLTLGSTAVTATAAELNLLDNVSGLVQADFTKLAAVDATAAELNIMDGTTSATGTTLALADRVVVNDDGTMKQVALSDFVTLMEGSDGIDAVNGNLTVGGNLTVNGNTVTVDAANMTVEDPLIKLNKGDTSSPARDQGFIFSRGNGSSADQANYAMLWVESADEFVFAAVGTEDATTSGNVTLSSYADLQAATIRGSKLEIDGANDYIDVDTDLKIIAAADVVIDPAGGELKVDGNVVPDSDSADSLGASGTAWANLFVDAIDLNGQGSISMGGTGRIDLDADDDTSIRASADDVITFEAGGTDRLSVGASALYPASDDGLALGSANNNFSDVFLADAAVLNFGDDQDTTLTHTDGTGLTLNSTNKLCFNDSATFVQSSANGQLDIDADVELELTAPTLDIDASTAVTITSPSVVIDSSTSDKPVLELKNSNADANPATLLFNHDSASPADDDELGEVVFNGDDDGGASTMFAKIVGVSSDVTDGTEDGALQFKFRANGAVKTVELGAGAGLTLPNDSTYGVVKAHSMVTYSDETLKTNIQPLESALETVNKLQGVSYDWKSDGSHDLGFIAQEVNKVVPQIVYGKGDGDLGLDYSKLTSILVEAVKEQQAQINDLKSKLDK